MGLRIHGGLVGFWIERNSQRTQKWEIRMVSGQCKNLICKNDRFTCVIGNHDAAFLISFYLGLKERANLPGVEAILDVRANQIFDC